MNHTHEYFLNVTNSYGFTERAVIRYLTDNEAITDDGETGAAGYYWTYTTPGASVGDDAGPFETLDAAIADAKRELSK